MRQDLETEVRRAPPGSLIVVGAAPTAQFGPDASPAISAVQTTPPGSPWLWAWAMPYVAQPPFSPADVADRAMFVVPRAVDCCLAPQWFERTVRTVADWTDASSRPPVVILTWNRSTGALTRVSEADAPCVRDQVTRLTGSTTPEELDEGMRSLIDRVRASAASGVAGYCQA